MPWVIGYSGGKDSTATLQLVWLALRDLPRDQLTKPIFVIATDTLVETPLIGGRNGAGKTTILEAVRLCLYGPAAGLLPFAIIPQLTLALKDRLELGTP